MCKFNKKLRNEILKNTNLSGFQKRSMQMRKVDKWSSRVDTIVSLTGAEKLEVHTLDDVTETSRYKFMRFVYSPWLDPFKSDPRHKIKQYKERENLVFMGDGDHIADFAGMRWYVSMVAREIDKGIPGVKLIVLGPNWDTFKDQYPSKSVEYYGAARSLEEQNSILDSARAYVCPIRASSGVNVNSVLAMGRSLPVITSPGGATGMCNICDKIITYNPMDPWSNETTSHVNSMPLLLARDIYEFSFQIKEVYYDEQKWLKYSSMAFAHVKTWFSKKEAARELDDIFKGLLTVEKKAERTRK